MTDRMSTAALAGAIITVGCIVAALGSFSLVSLELCPPPTPATLSQGCVSASLVPWYGLVLVAAIACAGVAVAAVGLVIYRRARVGPDHATSPPP